VAAESASSHSRSDNGLGWQFRNTKTSSRGKLSSQNEALAATASIHTSSASTILKIETNPSQATLSHKMPEGPLSESLSRSHQHIKYSGVRRPLDLTAQFRYLPIRFRCRSRRFLRGLNQTLTPSLSFRTRLETIVMFHYHTPKFQTPRMSDCLLRTTLTRLLKLVGLLPPSTWKATIGRPCQSGIHRLPPDLLLLLLLQLLLLLLLQSRFAASVMLLSNTYAELPERSLMEGLSKARSRSSAGTYYGIAIALNLRKLSV
jgi:hypothetical protein